MTRGAYYNEIDPFAAAWLRELIKQGHIAPGDVDTRSIANVTPADLAGYTQCHFFAGIGVWSYALRRAGWPDDRPVWTGSCPCQPFSAAGKQKADEDDRHLAPVWLRLIAERRPAVVFGEQVGAAIRVGWLDHVFTALEQSDYACGAIDFPACSVGAPHIRQRCFFCAVGNSAVESRERDTGEVSATQARLNGARLAGDGRVPVGLGDASAGVGVALGDTDNARPQGRSVSGADSGRDCEGGLALGAAGSVDVLAIANEGQRRSGRDAPGETHGPQSEFAGRGATNGFWRNADWLPCIDGKARPVESGAFPLAHGAPARVGRLRGYGNAIVAPQAVAFIESYMSI